MSKESGVLFVELHDFLWRRIISEVFHAEFELIRRAYCSLHGVIVKFNIADFSAA